MAECYSDVNVLTPAPRGERQLLMTLPDQIRIKSRGLPVLVRLENGYLNIQPQGCGEPDATHGNGSPVYLELQEGRLRVIVTPDINDEDTRTTIDLQAARECLRGQFD